MARLWWIYRFMEFIQVVRKNILKDRDKKKHRVYTPSGITQQGRLMIQKRNEIPTDAKKVPLKIKEISGKKYAIIGSDSDGEYKIGLNKEKDNVEVYKHKQKVYIRIV
jgi:hypothetical protein